MGLATDIARSLKLVPLSSVEIDERRHAARVRENPTTTLEGEVIERVTPTAAPEPVSPPETRVWD